MSDLELFPKAKALHEAGAIEDAIELYTTLLSTTPTDPELLHLLGLAVHEKGEHEKALDLIKRALTYRSPFPFAHNNLGSVLNTLGRFEEALGAFQKALDENPNFTDAVYNQGLALQRLNREKEAMEAYEHALALDPNLVDAQINMAGLAFKMGNHADAITGFHNVIEAYPDLAEVHLNLGTVLAAVGDHTGSVKAFSEAVRLLPDSITPQLKVAYALKASGDLSQAVDEFERAIELDPDCAPAHYELARLLADQNDPRTPDAQLNLGVVLLKNGDAEGALQAAESNLKLPIPRTRELLLKTVALRELGQWDSVKTLIGFDEYLVSASLEDSCEITDNVIEFILKSHSSGEQPNNTELESIEELFIINKTLLTEMKQKASRNHILQDELTRPLNATCVICETDPVGQLGPNYHADDTVVGLCIGGCSDITLEVGCPNITLEQWDSIGVVTLNQNVLYLFPAFWHYKLFSKETTVVKSLRFHYQPSPPSRQ